MKNTHIKLQCSLSDALMLSDEIGKVRAWLTGFQAARPAPQRIAGEDSLRQIQLLLREARVHAVAHQVPTPTTLPRERVKALVKSLQQELIQTGNYTGLIDGDPSPQTQAALQTWRAQESTP
jgi:hypothetical protein